MRLILIVWGHPTEIWLQPKEALCNAVNDALINAGIAEIYRRPDRWELRSENGTLIEKYRSPESLGMGDGARLFLSQRAGFAG